MKHAPDRPRRTNIRLQGYDYSLGGAYFVTICTRNRARLFGEIVGGEMRLSEAGSAVEMCWVNVPQYNQHVALDAFVVMPNHLHAILLIADEFAAAGTTGVPGPKPLGAVIRGFKAGVTSWYRANTNIYNVWQRNYFEHVTRSDRSFEQIQQYIADNPANWADDRENPDASPSAHAPSAGPLSMRRIVTGRKYAPLRWLVAKCNWAQICAPTFGDGSLIAYC